MFGQLSNRESLSDLVLCLQTQKSKWYHLGIGTSISKSNLAHANENRDKNQNITDFKPHPIKQKPLKSGVSGRFNAIFQRAKS